MAKKAKKPKTLRTWLTPHLRNIARTWPEKNKARDRAKVRVQIGFFKNGKPEYRTMFKCAGCLDNFPREQTAADHISPVVEVSGFVDWNTYIERLFCEADGYQILCDTCHLSKTLCENEERVEIKKGKKEDDLY